MSDDNIILFPTDRIKNKENTGVKDTKFQKRVEKEQTNKFIESAENAEKVVNPPQNPIIRKLFIR